MSKIAEMSLSEILTEIGLNVDERDMYSVLGRNEELFYAWKEILSQRSSEKRNMERRISELSLERDGINEEIIRRMFDINNIPDRIELKAEDFLQFEGSIDKQCLVLLTLYNWQKVLEQSDNQSETEKKRAKINVRKAIKMIGDEDFDITDIVYENGYAKKITAINSQELINIIRKSRRLAELQKPDESRQKRLEKIEQEIGLDDLVNVLVERDFQEGLTRSETIGGAIADQILHNGVKRYQELHPEINVWQELEREQEEEQQETNKDRNEGAVEKSLTEKIYESKQYKNSMKEAVLENYMYIDLDMLLLVSGFRYLEALEYNTERIKFEHMTENGTIKITEKDVVLIIQDVVTKIQQAIEGNPEFMVQYDNGTIIDYSKEELKKDLRRFREGRYIKREETDTAKARLLSNESTFLEIDEDILRTMDITDEEFKILIKNSEDNLIYLIKQGIIEEDEIITAIYAREGCSEAVFLTAYQKGLLGAEDIIKLFDDKRISGETIAKIEDGEIKQKISSYARDALRDSYLKVEEEEDAKPDVLERFVRCMVLYKKLNIEGRTKEDIEKGTFELISSFEDNISSKVLEELYQFGIISLEAAADWGTDLTDMLASNSIKPVDLRRLYEKQIISKDEIKNVLIKGNLTYEEKLDLIYSTFDGESEQEKEAREELIELLEIGIVESYRSDERNASKIRGKGNGAKGKEFITEPHTRWKLISLIDKDYSKGCLPEGIKVIDGHRVFLLPNHNKVVIERMHEKRNGKRVNAYGSATYVMGIEEFYKNINNIIIDGAINRTYLREASEEDKATKIIHSKHWGNAIKREFGINKENSKYTQEEIEEIDTAIANVEGSRKERE